MVITENLSQINLFVLTAKNLEKYFESNCTKASERDKKQVEMGKSLPLKYNDNWCDLGVRGFLSVEIPQ